MTREIISLARAERPEFTPRQVDLAKDLIGMGVARLAIASVLLGVDTAALNPSQVSATNRLISKCYKDLGHNIVDARNIRSQFMVDAVGRAARTHRVRVRIAS